MSIPVRFSQSLSIEGQQNRQARVGNPYAYLARIGISAVLEHLYRGANLVDVAQSLDVSVSLLRNWLEQEGHWKQVDEATSLSAEGYLSLGNRLLAEAQDKFQLDRAKAIIDHARWMAQRLNKPMYGTQDVQAQATTVSYVFNVGDNAQIVTAMPRTPPPIETDTAASQQPMVEFELIPLETLSPPDMALPDVGPFFTEGPTPKHHTDRDKDTLLGLWAQTED